MQPKTRRTFLAAGLTGVTAAALGLTSAPGWSDTATEARIGSPAPGFSLTDSQGKTVSLADFKGKTVVLEWTNHECPYVRKHYGGNAMQAMQKKWTAQGVVWLTLLSSAPGTQGHVSPDQANKLTLERSASPTAVLFDPQGQVGRS